MSGAGVSLLGVAAFSLLVVANVARTRSPIEPSVAMATVWMLAFVFIALSSGRLYGVSIFALSIFWLGVGAFSIGATVGSALPRRVHFRPVSGNDRDFFVFALLFFIIISGFPLYLDYLRNFSDAPLFSPRFFLEVRQGKLDEAELVDRVPIVNNLVVLSSIVAVLGYAVSGAGYHWRLLVAAMVGTAFLYNLLTAAKSGPLQLVVMLFVVYALRLGKFPLRSLIIASASILLLFGLVTAMRFRAVGVGGAGLGEAVEIAWHQFVNYLVSGPIGFSIYLDDPQAVRAVWDPWYFFKRTANYFGDFFDLPSKHADYVAIGDGLYYNVYTAFFSYYPDYGVGGVVVFMLGIGVFAGTAYVRARQGSVVWQILYAMIFYGICMSIFGESFLHALNPMVKSLMLVWLVSLLRRVRLGGWEVSKGELACSEGNARGKC